MAVPTIEPDSGRAWLVAVAAAAANGAAFGTAYTFGTFFDSMADEFGSDSGSTALLFGVTLLFFFGMGIVTGPIADRVGYHRLLAIGGTMFVAGLWATANVDSLTVGYVTYGLGVGVGSGCFIAPLTALVGLVFVQQERQVGVHQRQGGGADFGRLHRFLAFGQRCDQLSELLGFRAFCSGLDALFQAFHAQFIDLFGGRQLQLFQRLACSALDLA